jgi:hypothetical protein
MAHALGDGNGYWNNTTGTREYGSDGTYGSTPTAVTNPINAVGAYGNNLDVVVTSVAGSNNPFTNDAGNDFTLNSTTGAGALLRGAAPPGRIAGT